MRSGAFRQTMGQHTNPAAAGAAVQTCVQESGHDPDREETSGQRDLQELRSEDVCDDGGEGEEDSVEDEHGADHGKRAQPSQVSGEPPDYRNGG